MAEENSKKGASSLLNLNSLLALLTLVAGFWLVSQRLSSSRPVARAGMTVALGDQVLNARLWEDPLRDDEHVAEVLDKAEGELPSSDIEPVLDQIRTRSEAGAKQVLILPVMVSGGRYSEDVESRIRARYAVVSGLGRMGFAPEDAEHIGTALLPWPETAQIRLVSQQQDLALDGLWPKDSLVPSSVRSLFAAGASSLMELRYEWYRRRTFGRGSAALVKTQAVPDSVLVLWLDDSNFEDEPILRLPLLLEPMVGALSPVTKRPGEPAPHRAPVALIGPWRSSTLRAMLPDWKTVCPNEPDPFAQTYPSPKLREKVHETLGKITLYCATPSVMDEVLVPDDGPTRKTVGTFLTNAGFNAFHNLTATDADLAGQVLDELDLRHAELFDAKKPGTLVLISEWDTFYARMMSLTYGAELAIRQKLALTRREYIGRYVGNDPIKQDNFYSFVYLRGLDGQIVGSGNDKDSEDASKSRERRRTTPSSIEELRQWTPDSNKAQGQAQYDYLGRLGDQIAALDARLEREDKGPVKAIGIVGSDVFDTLLILQALRGRFPNALFFTTDLDVRFSHASERDWARNLIVASSYGLALDGSLQEEVPPFRDSKQTAIFAATLAALDEPHLARLASVPPRRFEIGNNVLVDLSTTNRHAEMTAATISPATTDQAGHEEFELHPATPQESLFKSNIRQSQKFAIELILAFAVIAGLCWLVPELRNLSYSRLRYPAKALRYTEEDIGGPEGAEQFALHLPAPNENGSLDEWLAAFLGPLLRRPTVVSLENLDPVTIASLQDDAKKGKLLDSQRKHWSADLARRMVAGLNHLVEGWREENARPSATKLEPEKEPPVGFRAKIAQEFRHLFLERRKRLERGEDVRRRLDEMLERISGAVVATKPKREIKSVVDAASDAREAAKKIYRLRLDRLPWMMRCVVLFGVVAIGVGGSIWWDSTRAATGEPFSLSAGISAWPAEIVRYLVAVLAAIFLLVLFYNGRETFYRLSRTYRLKSVGTPEKQMPDGTVCADEIWCNYRDGRSALEVAKRIGLPFVGYFVVLSAIAYVAGGFVMSPVRGTLAFVWDKVLLFGAVIGFLALSFVTMDAARSGSRFIRKLIGAPTRYSEATRLHFSSLRGDVRVEYLDEWIDLQLIADLTEYLSTLVYFPSILLVMLIAARNSWWDRWPWPTVLFIIFLLNFLLAAAGIVMLQRAAQRAKRDAEASLSAKIKQLANQLAASPAENDQNQAGKLLDEIRGIERGAFVPFWNSPVVGALFLSSGGTTAIQALIWFMGR